MLHIRTVSFLKNSRAITLPQDVLRSRGWENEQYLVIDDRDPDILIIRRLVFDEGGQNGKQDGLARGNRHTGPNRQDGNRP